MIAMEEKKAGKINGVLGEKCNDCHFYYKHEAR